MMLLEICALDRFWGRGAQQQHLDHSQPQLTSSAIVTVSHVTVPPLSPSSQETAPLRISLLAFHDLKIKEEKKQKSKGDDTIPRPISRFLPPGGAWVCSKLLFPPTHSPGQTGTGNLRAMSTSPGFSPKVN